MARSPGRERPTRVGRLLRAVAFVGLLAALSGCGQKPLDVSGQNLLFITIDTLRADRLGVYGYDGGATPNLDRLAARGIRFERAYAPAPLTLPSHATMFTGRYPYATGVRINGMHFLEEDEQTLAELFKARGYTTAAFVSAYVVLEKFGLGQGFDEYDDALQTSDGLFRFYSETPADEIYRRFASWLGRERTTPFFCWVHLYDPHQPFEPPTPYSERFADDPYNGEIAFVDEQVGRMLRELDERGLTDSTMVLVTSDHGEAFGEHVEVGHGLLTYDETLRVPLILSAPGRLAQNVSIRNRVSLADLTPTLSELFMLGLSAEHQGRSLVRLLDGAGDSTEVPLYFESLAGVQEKNWAPRQGVIAEGHKFIRLPRSELYDLEADPGEEENLLRRERERADALDGELQRMLLGEPKKRSAERELTAEDRRQLEALGYLSSSGLSRDVIDPKIGIDIEVRTRSAKALVQAGELDRAEATLAEVLADYPDVEVIDIYELRWEIFSRRGDEEGAIAALEAGIKKLPQSTIDIKLASYLHAIGRLDEAEQQARLILDRDPRHSHAISLLGMIDESRGDLAGARGHFQRALEVEPRSVPLQAKIAELEARLGNTPSAIAIYDRLTASGALDGDGENLFKAAALYSATGDLARAESLFLSGLALEPAGQHFLALSIVQLGLGKSSSAVTNLETALGTYRQDLEPPKLALAEALLQQARAAGG